MITETMRTPHQSDELLQGIVKREDPTWVKVQNISKRTFSSSLFWTTLTICVFTAFTVTAITCPALIPIEILLPVVGVGLALLGIKIYLLRKSLRYELLLSFNIFMHAISPKSKPWWNSITDNITLGAIPLKNKGHIEQIEEEGVTAVVSLLELFEFNDKMFSVPAKCSDWTTRQITHKHIAAEDFKVLPLHKIDEVVEYMHKNISNGKKLYIHCKSGVGRSATAVACYLLKYQPDIDTVEKALAEVTYHRPQVHLNKKQVNQIRLYYQTITRPEAV